MTGTSANRKRIPYIALVLGVLAMCGNALAQDKHIDVSVQQNGGAYKLVFNNSECPDSPSEKGCVFAAKGSQPVISWELTGDLAGQWHFTRLQFSPDGNHWGESGYPLANCTVEDFGLTAADRISGSASTAQVIGHGQKMQIRDRNQNECTTHYRIYAEPVGGGGEIDSDPRIKNGGK